MLQCIEKTGKKVISDSEPEIPSSPININGNNNDGSFEDFMFLKEKAAVNYDPARAEVIRIPEESYSVRDIPEMNKDPLKQTTKTNMANIVFFFRQQSSDGQIIFSKTVNYPDCAREFIEQRENMKDNGEKTSLEDRWNTFLANTSQPSGKNLKKTTKNKIAKNRSKSMDTRLSEVTLSTEIDLDKISESEATSQTDKSLTNSTKKKPNLDVHLKDFSTNSFDSPCEIFDLYKRGEIWNKLPSYYMRKELPDYKRARTRARRKNRRHLKTRDSSLSNESMKTPENEEEIPYLRKRTTETPECYQKLFSSQDEVDPKEDFSYVLSSSEPED